MRIPRWLREPAAQHARPPAGREPISDEGYQRGLRLAAELERRSAVLRPRHVQARRDEPDREAGS
jgi:hypothetical protein